MVRLEVHVNNTLLRKLQRDQIGPGYSENFVIGWLIISILSTHVTVIFSSYSLLFTNSILHCVLQCSETGIFGKLRDWPFDLFT